MGYGATEQARTASLKACRRLHRGPSRNYARRFGGTVVLPSQPESPPSSNLPTRTTFHCIICDARRPGVKAAQSHATLYMIIYFCWFHAMRRSRISHSQVSQDLVPSTRSRKLQKTDTRTKNITLKPAVSLTVKRMRFDFKSSEEDIILWLLECNDNTHVYIDTNKSTMIKTRPETCRVCKARNGRGDGWRKKKEIIS